MPPTVWCFEQKPPPKALVLEPGTCIVAALARAAEAPVCVSASAPGCPGAAFYLGFGPASPRAGAALSSKERFKSCVALGDAFYRDAAPPAARSDWIVIRSLQSIDERARRGSARRFAGTGHAPASVAVRSLSAAARAVPMPDGT